MPFRNPEEKKAYDREYYRKTRGFSVVGESPKHFSVRHPSGSVFKVAKKGLSKLSLGKLKSFAEGGEPAYSSGVPHDAMDAFSSLPTAFRDAPPPDLFTPAPPPPAPRTGYDIIDDPAEPLRDIGGVLGRINQPRGGFDIIDAMNGRGPTQPSAEPSADALGSAPEERQPKPDLAPELLRDPNSKFGLSMSTSSRSRVGLPGIRDPEKLSGDLPGTAGQERALNQSVVNDELYAQAQHELFAGHELRKQELLKQHEAKMADRDAKRDAMRKDIEDYKIEPGRYWANKSNGQKALSLVSMFVGTMGSSMSRTPNYVAQMFDKLVEQDIEAQRANLGKKQSLLSNYMEETKDVRQAQQLAKADLTDSFATQLKMAAAKFQGENAAPEAMYKIAELHNKAAGYRKDVDAFNAQQALNAEGLKLQRAIAILNAQKQSESIELQRAQVVNSLGVRDLDGSVIIAASESDRKDLNDAFESARIIYGNLGRMKEFIDESPHGKWVWGTEDQQRAQSLVTGMTSQVARMWQKGVLSDRDMAIYERMVPDIQSFKISPTALQGKMEELAAVVRRSLDAIRTQRRRIYEGPSDAQFQMKIKQLSEGGFL